MKFTTSLLLLFCLFLAKDIQAQEIDITGTWTMYEMIWTTAQGDEKTTEDQLKDEGMSSEYSFMPDGKVELNSNMTGSGNLETLEGTWKLEGEKLTFTFILPNGNPTDIVWDFYFKDEAIHLTRNSPDMGASVINSFKRK